MPSMRMLLLDCTIVILLVAAINATASKNVEVIEIGCKLDDPSVNGTTNSIDYGPRDCTHGKCHCQLLDDALKNLTSNMTIVITADVVLSSLFVVSDLINISIIGANNKLTKPTIKCSEMGGGVQFLSCHNCVIDNIIWDGCGVQSPIQNPNPVIQLDNSINVIIRNCSFQNSVGQAIVFTGPGDVTIDNCKFVHNNLHKGHGTAIHYTSKYSTNSSSLFVENCNFTKNGNALSIVYIGPSELHTHSTIIKNSVFYKNLGSPVYLSNNGLAINGSVQFEDNLAGYGGGIFAEDDSDVRVCKNSTVLFSNSVADNEGGAIYMSNHSSVLFEQDSRVSFHNNKARSGGGISSNNNCYITLEKNSVVNFVNNSATAFGGAVLLHNASVLTLANSKIAFNNNSADGAGGALYVHEDCSIIIKMKSAVTFHENTASYGGAILCMTNSDFRFNDNSTVTFSKNSATIHRGGAINMLKNCSMSFEQASVVAFTNNQATKLGGVAYILNSTITFKDHSKANISQNTARANGGALYLEYANITFDNKTSVTFSENFASQYGGALYLHANSWITFQGSSTVIFQNNTGLYGAGAVCFERKSTLISREYAVSQFSGNSCRGKGGAIRCEDDSRLIVDESSTLNANNNTALYGGAVSLHNCKHIFEGNSKINFFSNSATFLGGVILSTNSAINFQGSIEAHFNNNRAKNGGGLSCRTNSTITTNENSSLTFSENKASNYGGSLNLDTGSNFTTDGNSNITFHNNRAVSGGAIYGITNSNIHFKGNSVIKFIANEAEGSGGAVCSNKNSTVYIRESCKIAFTNNHALVDGGALRTDTNCHVHITENSIVTFSHNSARQNGGALHLRSNSDITIRNNTKIVFMNNTAIDGGGVYVEKISYLMTDGNATISFVNNTVAGIGGGIFGITNSNVTCKGNSFVTFNNNRADFGGGSIGAREHSRVVHIDNCTTVFYNNHANQGGAMYLQDNSSVTHKGNTTARYLNNTARDYGGVVHCKDNSDITFDEELTLTITGNNATRGGAFSLIDNSNMTVTGNSVGAFISNRAHYGGVIYTEQQSNITLTMDASITYDHNIADVCGGAVMVYKDSFIKFEGRSNMTFKNNKAGYSGALHSERNSMIVFSEESAVVFNKNSAIITGGAVGVVEYSDIKLNGNSAVVFDNNTVQKLCTDGVVHKNISQYGISKNLTIKWINCTSIKTSGGAIDLQNNSNSEFEGNTTVMFSYNSAQNEGGAIASNMSDILFTQNCQVSFIGNQAKLGGSIFSNNNSTVRIDKYSRVKFNNTSARVSGGELYSNRSYDIIVDSNGMVTCNGINTFPICINDICFCKHLENALANLPLSNNVIIRLKIDVILPSIVILKDLKNFTMIGHNNPTVHCANTGGLHFISCHGCKFEGIDWDGCGSNDDGSPGLKFENSSNITIQNCSFHHSVAQTVVLSKVSGDVNINNCEFANNTYSTGNGAAIHYSTSNGKHFPVKRIISNSRFTSNTGKMSLVYTEGHNASTFILRNTSFTYNKGRSIHLMNQDLYMEGQNLFAHNHDTPNASCIYADNYSTVTFDDHSMTNFDYNTVMQNGGAIVLTNHSSLVFERNSVVEFNKNFVIMDNGGSVYATDNSKIIFKGSSNVLFNHNDAWYGGAMYIEGNSDIIFDQNCNVTFQHNKADVGAAVCIYQRSRIIATGNSSLQFHNNTAYKQGGAIYLHNMSTLAFIQNTTVTFYNNVAVYGGAVSSAKRYSRVPSDNIIFGGTSNILFVQNSATYGGAVYANRSLNILFNENSSISFTNNTADYGGAIFSENNGKMIFKGSSASRRESYERCSEPECNVSNSLLEEFIIKFKNNEAKHKGGAIYLAKSSSMIFAEESRLKVLYTRNEAASGGAIHIEGNSHIIFGGRSTAVFYNNIASQDGGAVYCHSYSYVTFEGYLVKFYYNRAAQGGAVYIESNSNITFKQNSTTEFIKNTGSQHGGALFTKFNCDVRYEEYSYTLYVGNNALMNGGSMYTKNNSIVIIKNNSTVTFSDSTAHNGFGGAVYSALNSQIITKGNTVLTTTNNYATQGGAFYSSSNSTIIFTENVVVHFNNNAAIPGIVLNIYTNSFNIIHESRTKVDNTKARQNGGAINLEKNSAIEFRGNVTINFSDNKATSGGAVYANDNSIVTITENSTASFSGNSAKLGGAIYLTTSNININANCSVAFYNNTAWQDGGAMFLDEQYVATFSKDVSISFDYNTASDYGGAVYSRFNQQSNMYFYATKVNFSDNHARTAGKSVFINVAKSCNSSCLNNGVIGMDLQSNPIRQHVTTSPRKLKLYQPAICIGENKNETEECGSYFVNNIMLGEEVIVNACMHDYYDQPSDDARFIISDNTNNKDYYIPGSKYILVSCNNSFNGIKLLSNKNTLPALPYNYSMRITLYVNRQSEMKNIFVDLIIGLGQCHPGFWYYPNSMKCECYNASDIVFCSGSSSTIRRGYWFGSVNGKPTVTFCPINYCNFTCCETSNGYYHLSPVRDNQCRSHRSGTACGSCKEGYTLSFDSPDCVSVKNCTVGMTMLVLLLTIFYWILIFIAVFLMMHFKLNIGNLYAITYYYSVVDLLLSQNCNLSNELYATINAISSIAKVTPQFLGKLCFIENMSGIDQQFIHYIHPTAVWLFLVIITMLARKSSRLSAFVSKTIIRAICCLLLLSYTSVATTSLLLMRPLIFHDIDEVYTYVSPDVKYFHGRHLVYAIVAVLFTVVIVIGLPLLLTLEPFLNSKINFTKIKPLLDQFQCCYKDKYRFFAGYYMICRLVIITIVIISSSNSYIFQFLLITACVTTALIHHILKPYNSDLLNTFDGTILHLLILVSVLPLVDSFDTFNSDLLVGIAFILVLLPIVSFTAVKLITSRQKIKRVMGHCYFRCTRFCLNSKNYDELPLVDIIKSPTDSNIVVNNNRRINTTIHPVDQTDERLPDIIWCREPFLEVLNDIEDIN